MFDEALTLTRELRSVVRDHIDVFVLDVQRAAWSFAVVLGAGIAIALLVISTWSTWMDAATMSLVNAGMLPPIALMLIGLGNLVAAVLAYALMRFARRRIALPATRRLLTPTSTVRN